MNTPLPESDGEGSDSFYSPQSSYNQQQGEQQQNRPDVDEPAANVVIATEGIDRKRSDDGSFIASAEDEEEESVEPAKPVLSKQSAELTQLRRYFIARLSCCYSS